MPVVARSSSARWAAAASASGKVAATTGVSRPSAAAARAASSNGRRPPGRCSNLGPTAGAGGDAAGEQVTGGQLQRLAGRPPEHHHPAARREEVERGLSGLAADAVEQRGDGSVAAVAEGGDHAIGPVGLAVVDGDVGPEVAHEVHLGGAAGQADGDRSGTVRGLDEQRAEPARRRGDQHHVVGGEVGHLEDAHRGAAGADHGDGSRRGHVVGQRVECGHRGQGLLGVAAAGLAEVGDDAAADPDGVDAGPGAIDAAGHLPPRGHRQVGKGEGPARLAGADRGVDEVDPGGLDGDADLALAGVEVGHLLQGEGVGPAEFVLADGVHGGLRSRWAGVSGRSARPYDLKEARGQGRPQ